MPTTSLQKITDLKLDLKNFRTVPQKGEKNAIKAMIAIKPDRFYAIMESIIEDGYIPTENIIVLKEDTTLTVKEGNRRIAALKLIHGQYKISEFGLPESILNQVAKLDDEWKKDNLSVPCTIFNKKEEAKAERVVALAHGKGEKASRDNWSSVARARHNRDAKKVPEPALDLLEKYLKNGSNINNQQKERWAGEYPLTILHEALRLIHARLGFVSIATLVSAYPKMQKLAEIEDLVRDVGIELVSFKILRDTQKDFALKYGASPIPPSTPTSTPNAKATAGKTSQNVSKSQPLATTPPTSIPSTDEAFALSDPKHVIAQMKKFVPKGDKRTKVATLRDEVIKMNIKNTPIAFCFIVRSMFEISARAYCDDYKITVKKVLNNKTYDKSLAELLKDVTNHLTTNKTNKSFVKTLHGAYTELSKKDGILSVTSMNQLVHHETFSALPSDVCRLFGNIYPLLEAMN